MEIVWTREAKKDLKKLETDTAERIIEKIENVADFPDHYLYPLTGYDLHAARIGDYRAIVKKENDKITIITVGHRKNVYRHY